MRNANGASLLLETLLDEGVTHLFGNPGTTELPLMDALVNEERLAFILTLHEGVAISAAEGYGLSTGRPAAINLHVAPGLGNAMGLLYNAKRSGAPMLVTAGNQPQSGHFQEIILYDDLARMAEPLVKWSYEVRRVEDLEQAVRRAVKVSMTPPTGPVFLSLPGDVMLSPASDLQEKPTRIHTRFAAAAESVEAAAALIARAERPCIVAGAGVAHSGALEEAARFAEQIGAKAYEENFANVISFPMAHPLYAGKLPILARPLRERLGRIRPGVPRRHGGFPVLIPRRRTPAARELPRGSSRSQRLGDGQELRSRRRPLRRPENDAASFDRGRGARADGG